MCNRFRFRDGSLRDAQTHKTKVASFHGHQFVAERQDDELVVFMLSDEPMSGVNVGSGGTTHDFAQRRLSDMNRAAEDFGRRSRNLPRK